MGSLERVPLDGVPLRCFPWVFPRGGTMKWFPWQGVLEGIACEVSGSVFPRGVRLVGPLESFPRRVSPAGVIDVTHYRCFLGGSLEFPPDSHAWRGTP